MGRICLSPTGNNSNDGLTFDTAKRTLGAAFAAADHMDVILVAPGTYPDPITVPANASRKIVGLKILAPADEDLSDYDHVAGAADIVQTMETEPITEPVGQAIGLTRPVRVILTSASLRRRAIQQIVYSHPPSSKAWGGIADFVRTVEAF